MSSHVWVLERCCRASNAQDTLTTMTSLPTLKFFVFISHVYLFPVTSLPTLKFFRVYFSCLFVFGDVTSDAQVFSMTSLPTLKVFR